METENTNNNLSDHNHSFIISTEKSVKDIQETNILINSKKGRSLLQTKFRWSSFIGWLIAVHSLKINIYRYL